jgi:glycosyltransferase involved in cell wall biosynthesis
MNILLLLQEFPYPLTHGFRIRLLNHISIFANFHKCYLISFVNDSRQEDIDEFKKNFPQVKIIGLYAIIRKKNIYKQGIKFVSHGKPIFLARWHNQELHNFLRTIDMTIFDCVYFDGLGVSPYIRYFKNIPSIISTSDAVSLAYQNASRASHNIFKKVYMFYASRMIAKFEKEILPSFYSVHVVSEDDKKYYESVLNIVNVQVIEHVVSNEIITYNISSVETRKSVDKIIFPGNLEVESISRGFLAFLQYCYPDVIKAFPDIKLIVMSKKVPSRIKRKIKKLSNIKHIKWVDDYYGELLKGDVILFCDWTGTGVKTRVLFALALGKAIVATPVAMQGIKVKDGEHCLIRLMGKGFKDALIELLRNYEMRMKIGKHAKKLIIEQYSLHCVEKKWNHLFTSINNMMKND